jgi:hypothetical protein
VSAIPVGAGVQQTFGWREVTVKLARSAVLRNPRLGPALWVDDEATTAQGPNFSCRGMQIGAVDPRSTNILCVWLVQSGHVCGCVVMPLRLVRRSGRHQTAEIASSISEPPTKIRQENQRDTPPTMWRSRLCCLSGDQPFHSGRLSPAARPYEFCPSGSSFTLLSMTMGCLPSKYPVQCAAGASTAMKQHGPAH